MINDDRFHRRRSRELSRPLSDRLSQRVNELRYRESVLLFLACVPPRHLAATGYVQWRRVGSPHETESIPLTEYFPFRERTPVFRKAAPLAPRANAVDHGCSRIFRSSFLCEPPCIKLSYVIHSPSPFLTFPSLTPKWSTAHRVPRGIHFRVSQGADFGACVGMRSPEGRNWFRTYFESAITVPRLKSVANCRKILHPKTICSPSIPISRRSLNI